MRLINADEIQYAKDWVVTDKIPKVGGYNAKAIYRVTKEEIDAMPTVDAAPVKRGRWIHHKGGYSDHYECTACGKPIVLTAKWDFCPNCGADMRGEHEKAD